MGYARKNSKNVAGSIAVMITIAALAMWQFYTFVMFSGSQSGNSQLWWASAMGALACGAAFMVFSVFIRHDTDDDLHIAPAPGATRI